MVEAQPSTSTNGQFQNLSEIPTSVMNEEVKEHEPSLEDTFFIIASGDYQRLIFQGLDLREREETHLNDFRNFLKVKNFSLPDGYDDENRLVLRFLQGLKWDYQKTYDEILEHAQFRSQLDLDFEHYRQELELGVIYGCRRDKNMRPIIIVNVRRMIDSRISIERLVAVTNFFFEYVIQHAMVPGAIESWTAIFDLKDVGVTEIPKDRIQPLINNMTKNYRGRLFRFFAVDVTWVVRQLWKFAHRFVDEFTNKKLTIYGDNYFNHM